MEKGSIRIQSREFVIVQHFGSAHDIPALSSVSESASTASLASEMSESVMMESMALQTHGQLACSSYSPVPY